MTAIAFNHAEDWLINVDSPNTAEQYKPGTWKVEKLSPTATRSYLHKYIAVRPGATYTVNIMAKTFNPDKSSIRLEYKETLINEVLISHPDWKMYSLRFTIPMHIDRSDTFKWNEHYIHLVAGFTSDTNQFGSSEIADVYVNEENGFCTPRIAAMGKLNFDKGRYWIDTKYSNVGIRDLKVTGDRSKLDVGITKIYNMTYGTAPVFVVQGYNDAKEVCARISNDSVGTRLYIHLYKKDGVTPLSIDDINTTGNTKPFSLSIMGFF